MAARFWHVLFLPAFFVPALATIHWECLGQNVEKCEGEHIDRVKLANAGEGEPDFPEMCNSLETLIDCAQIDCGGDAWNATNDYLTKQLQFSQATGLCGGEMKTNACANEVGKECLEKMADSMAGGSSACVYYGVYAQCVITAGPDCDDDTTTALVKEMKRQLKKKMPTVFGQETVSMCEKWPGEYLA